jgi:uncharacterized membrane protein YccC
MNARVILGLLLLAAGVAVIAAAGVMEWPFPLNIVAGAALCLPGASLVDPPLECRVGRWLGRPVE